MNMKRVPQSNQSFVKLDGLKFELDGNFHLRERSEIKVTGLFGQSNR